MSSTPYTRVHNFSSGIRLIYQKRPEVKKSTIAVQLDIGSMDDEKHHGIAHFAEHLMFKSTSKHTTEEITNKLELTGCEYNAFTEYDKTTFYISVLPEFFTDMTNLLCEMLTDKNISKEEFDSEKEVVLQELRNYSDDCLSNLSDLYGLEQHNLVPIIGSETTVKNITQNDFLFFWQYYYNQSNMTISVVTPDLSFKEVKELISKTFCKEVSTNINYKIMHEEPNSTLNDTPFYLGEKYTEIKDKFNCAAVGISIDMSEFPAHYCQILSNLLKGGSSSALYKTIREQDGLVYSFKSESFFFPTYNMKDYLIMVQIDKANVDTYIERFKEVIKDFHKYVSQDNLTMFINKLKGAELTSEEYAITNLKYDNERIYPDGYTFEDRIQDILDTSFEDILECAESCLQSEKLKIAVL